LKEEALDRTVWRIRFGRGYGPAVRQARGWMNEWMNEGMAQHLRRRYAVSAGVWEATRPPLWLPFSSGRYTLPWARL
jgi:hypothetical protein